MAKIFVYGTLKKNQRTHHLLKSLDAAFVEIAETDSSYKLYKVDWFPGMVKSNDGEGGVKGEVYEISREALQKIDRYEGISSGLFVREEINTTSGKLIAYLYNDEVNESNFIESGIWKE